MAMVTMTSRVTKKTSRPVYMGVIVADATALRGDQRDRTVHIRRQ
jgi:hypothetical protein